MSCNKVSYPSGWHAVQALHAMQARGRSERAIYPCRDCKAWHLTSSRAGLEWAIRNGWMDREPVRRAAVETEVVDTRRAARR